MGRLAVSRSRFGRKAVTLVALLAILSLLHSLSSVPSLTLNMPGATTSKSLTETMLDKLRAGITAVFPKPLAAQVLVVATVSSAQALALLPRALIMANSTVDCSANSTDADVSLLLMHRSGVAMPSSSELRAAFPCVKGGIDTMVFAGTDRFDAQGFYGIFANKALRAKHRCLLWWGPVEDTSAVREDWQREVVDACSIKSGPFWMKGADVAGGKETPHLHPTALINWHDDNLATVVTRSMDYIAPDNAVFTYDQAIAAYLTEPHNGKYRRLARKNIVSWTAGVQTQGMISSLESTDEALLHTFILPSNIIEVSKVSREYKDGISIICGARNRNDFINQTLPTWYMADGISEVILIDWGSDSPLWNVVRTHISRSPIPIRVISVPTVKAWALAPALNLAASYAQYSRILKLDSDSVLERDFVQHHPVIEGGFYAGNYRRAQELGNLNAQHLNGIAFFQSVDWERINGYDERIISYGWDDDDVYERAMKLSLTRNDLNYDKISHQAHEDDRRSSLKCVSCSITINQSAVHRLTPWDPSFSSTHCLLPEISRDDNDYINPDNDHFNHEQHIICHELSGYRYPLRTYFSDNDWNVISTWGSQVALAGKIGPFIDYNVIRNVHSPKSLEIVDLLYSSANSNTTRYLIVHPQNGLGNRIRAYVSAKVVAKNTNRKLIVLWERDSHCQAAFEDLFSTNELVLAELDLRLLHTNIFKTYNYQEWEEGAHKNEVIHDSDADSKHIYVKSSFQLFSPHTSNKEEDEVLHSLVPSEDVQDIITNFFEKNHAINNNAATLSNFIGAHIRMETNVTQDVQNLNENEFNAMSEATSYRSKCHYTYFLHEMRKLSNDTKFFVAIDTPQYLPAMQEALGGNRVQYLDRDGACAFGTTRDDACVIYALADMILLSQTQRVIGSDWSSFTEIATRWSGAPGISGCFKA